MPGAKFFERLDWGNWVYGLWVAIVTGASNSVIAGLGLNLMDPKDFNLQQGKLWGFVGGLFLIGAVKDFFLYINKHPAPEIISQETHESVRVTQVPFTGMGTGDGTATKTVTTKVEEKVAISQTPAPVEPDTKP